MGKNYVSLDDRGALAHYGMPRRSGRYPWGSGEDPYQRSMDFTSRVQSLKKQGMREVDIVKAMGFKTTQELRDQYSTAVNEQRIRRMETARALLDDGKTQAEVARQMGIPESTLRSYLNEKSAARTTQAKAVAEGLKKLVDEKGMLDVGAGVERELNVSPEKLRQALSILKKEGYETFGGGLEQATNPGQQTNMKVLTSPGTQHKDIYAAFEKGKVAPVVDYKVRQDADGNDILVKGFVYPKSMDSSRLAIRYAEDGGNEKDGLVELRRGVEDLSLGESRYAQVRILVDNDRFIKGMAAYSDNLPDGVDVMFNTNKSQSVPMREVLKPISDDPDNPFGSLIKEKGGQSTYIDANGNEQLRLINKRADEGDWGEWSDSLPSQFLSKQPRSLIQKQLGLAIQDKQIEFDDIKALNNPTVKRIMLESFADDCDAAAVHLRAAALPRQKYQVIFPVKSLKDTEAYAPNYDDGETLALIRFPHGGTFEIPIVTVNNRNSEAKSFLGSNPQDAIGINSKVAARLSGADFDGDTVMAIPTGNVKISSTRPLGGLIGFDAKTQYGYDHIEIDADGEKHYFRAGKEFKKMRNTGTEMGKISNLITDMTLRGAKEEELERAVKHSMVVIDAAKHGLDHKQSYEDNGIAALRRYYMGRYDDDGKLISQGASTLISRASAQASTPRTIGSPKINQIGKTWYDPSQPEGALIWEKFAEPYTVTKTHKITGKVTEKTVIPSKQSTQMAEVKDAFELSSGTVQERYYAEYANKMKALANEARKEQVYTGRLQRNATAAKAYSEEVESLKIALDMALKNAPRERQAQLIARSVVTAKKQANEDISAKELGKIAQQALASARLKVGAKRNPIVISNKQWEAIQAGAISDDILTKILRNSDVDIFRSLATPRERRVLSSGKQARLFSLKAGGATNAEIARALGISVTTVSSYLNGKE